MKKEHNPLLVLIEFAMMEGDSHVFEFHRGTTVLCTAQSPGDTLSHEETIEELSSFFKTGRFE